MSTTRKLLIILVVIYSSIAIAISVANAIMCFNLSHQIEKLEDVVYSDDD